MTRTRKSAKSKAPAPVIFLIVAFLCPTEFSLFLDGLRLPPHRIAILLLLPVAMMRLLVQRGLKLRGFDVAFLLFNVWTAAIFTYHHGNPDGLVYGGSLAVDGLGAYLIARTWIRDSDTFHAALRALATAVIVAGLIALPETLLGQTFTHNALKALTGYHHPTAVETRVGLTRAYGTFDHPIHYGTFCAALLAMFWYAETTPYARYRRAAILAGATLLGLSSAPLLCLGLQTAMLVWERATRGVTSRTSITLLILAGLYVGAACVSTRSPINIIATGMTLDSWTGYYRLQIWEFGLDNVYANPLTGIGLNDWQRPAWMVSSTVDAFWLVIVMREGVPALILLFAAIGMKMRAVVRRGLASRDLQLRRLSRGWLMSLIALSLIGTTVHYWNVPYAFFFFFLGLAGWIADPKRMKAPAASRARMPPVGAVGRDYGRPALPSFPQPIGAMPMPA
ncbi:MAG: O-antigen ligase family protein [Hyphomicrobium sp.]